MVISMLNPRFPAPDPPTLKAGPVASDNPEHYDYAPEIGEISIIGEWIWLGRTSPGVR
jgi:hypothetical protein